MRLAKLAQESGLRGVVASPHEVAAIREACGDAMRHRRSGHSPRGERRGRSAPNDDARRGDRGGRGLHRRRTADHGRERSARGGAGDRRFADAPGSAQLARLPSRVRLHRAAARDAVRSRAGEEDALAGELAAISGRIRSDRAQHVLASGDGVEVRGDAPRRDRRRRRNVDARRSGQRRRSERAAVEQQLHVRDLQRAGDPAVDLGAAADGAGDRVEFDLPVINPHAP